MPKGEPHADRVLEQKTTGAIDWNQRAVIFTVREKFAIRPSVFAVPFDTLDFIQWQRMTVELQAKGMLQQTGEPAGAGPADTSQARNTQ